MRRPIRSVAAHLLATLVLAVGCHGGPPVTTPLPAPAPIQPAAPHDTLVAAAPSRVVPVPVPLPLPPVPLVEGPLKINVVYPPAGHSIESRDSSFILGSVGNGRATLTVDGRPAKVFPNGAFLAYLANPLPTAAGTGRYDLLAAAGTDTARLAVPVRLLPPRPVLSAAGALVVDTASVAPRGTIWLGDDDRVRVAVRAPRNATVMLTTPGDRLDLVPTGADSVQWVRDVYARQLRDGGSLVISRGADTVRLPVVRVDPPTENGQERDILVRSQPDIPDTDDVVSGRPVPGETYRWFLMPDTKLEITGRINGQYRVRLDRAMDIWLAASDVALTPAQPFPRRVAGNARLRSEAGWEDLLIPLADRPPYFVEEGDHQIVLTLYGTTGNSDIIRYVTADSLVRDVEWDAPATDRVRYTVHLGGQTGSRPFGYLVLYEHGNLILRVRRPPVIDVRRPLAGLMIAVDPGHPPEGSTGPTGLYEGAATLAVGERLERLLVERGARVTMTRTTMSPVPLATRPVIARRAGADAFVSIHLNAYPDGVDPFTPPNGTGTYFYRAHSEPLARAVQRALVGRLGLPDEGIFFRSLAVVRHTWFPSVLCEGAFVIVPEQEAAMRTPEFQERYALGIVEGLEAYFRGLAR